MRKLDSLINLGMDWESFDHQFVDSDRPPREALIQFLVKRLSSKVIEVPVGVVIRIERAWGNHLYLTGTINKGSDVDRIQGEVVWLPRSHNFRGHLHLNMPSSVESCLEEIEVLRNSNWHIEKWQTKNESNKHDHCRICWQAIYETNNEIEGTGYTNGYDWLCQKCYSEHL